jgi:hypothetical protein
MSNNDYDNNNTTSMLEDEFIIIDTEVNDVIVTKIISEDYIENIKQITEECTIENIKDIIKQETEQIDTKNIINTNTEVIEKETKQDIIYEQDSIINYLILNNIERHVFLGDNIDDEKDDECDKKIHVGIAMLYCAMIGIGFALYYLV